MNPGAQQSWWQSLIQWFDADAAADGASEGSNQGIDWVRIFPFIAVHLMCFGVIWVGWSGIAVGVAVGLYLLRMFAITGFYHRYFSHRAFKTSRALQFVFAVIGASSVQRGPMWWAAHHRGHHRYSDTEKDPHSPRGGFWRSHMLWFLYQENFATHKDRVRDWAKFPELRALDRFDLLVPVSLAVALFLFGHWAEAYFPEWGTSAGQMLIWGFFVSTTALYHGTFTINSLSHKFGRKRFETGDDSLNNPWLAVITLGEGWHNNHHRYPASARQGFYWWEYDVTYYLLRILSAVGLVWDLRPVPERVLEQGRQRSNPAIAQGTDKRP
ncbi:MAG: acyl-CoA desaturase [Lysobacterales bacterium]